MGVFKGHTREGVVFKQPTVSKQHGCSRALALFFFFFFVFNMPAKSLTVWETRELRQPVISMRL